jgi:hypothetical protein
MTYRVEVTAATINELSGKLAALASQLKGLPSTFDVLRIEASEISLPAPVQERVCNNGYLDPAPVTAPVTYDYVKDITPLVLKLVDKRGRPAVEDVLKSFGAKRASLLDPAQYDDFVSAINAAMEG